jgi:subtilisin
MTRFTIRGSVAGIFVLLFLNSLNAAAVQPQQPQQNVTAARAPRDARVLQNRTDLTNLFRDKPEIRIIVGLEPRQDNARPAIEIDDQNRERSVATRQAAVLTRVRGLNVRDITQFRFHPFIAMTVDATALLALIADPDVTSVSEDGIIFPMLTDTVSITRANSAWSEGFRGAGQTVAIIDTGVDSSHPFLAGKIVAEACFSNPAGGNTSLCPNGQPQQFGAGAAVHCPDIAIGCWHGSHVAGIAVGNYGQLNSTTGGIAHGANLMPIQVFQRECDSSTCQLAAYYSDIMQSLEYVYSLRNTYSIAAANLSLGGVNFVSNCDNEAPGVTAAIHSLRAANIPTVVSAGNSGMTGALAFPACISEAISVGSTTKQNTISSFSNSASFLTMLAPGQTIQSAVPGGGYGYTSGTSMSAPHVAGAWATLKSAKPAATVTEVLDALTTTGLPITDQRNGLTKRLVQIGDSATELGALGMLLGRSNPGSAPPAVTITATDVLGKEAGLDPAAFTVTRTGSTASQLTVQYKVNGTAAPGADYQTLSGTITIPAGASTALIVVTPLDDALVESNETIVVTVLAASSYTVGTPSSATVKIASDDSSTAFTRSPLPTGSRQLGRGEGGGR